MSKKRPQARSFSNICAMIAAIWGGVISDVGNAEVTFRSLVRDVPAFAEPQSGSPVRFHLARGTPVELIQIREAWAQIRDHEGGELVWVPAEALSEVRTVITLQDGVEVRSAPREDAAIWMLLQSHTVLVLSEESRSIPGWLAVETRRGLGFVRKRDVWGW